jgi:hypothetical protein
MVTPSHGQTLRSTYVAAISVVSNETAYLDNRTVKEKSKVSTLETDKRCAVTL